VSKLTDIRRYLKDGLPLDERIEVVSGPSEGPRAFGRGVAAVQMLVRVYTGRPGSERAQERLDELLSNGEEGSVWNYLLDLPKDKALITSLQVVGNSGWRTWQIRDPETGEAIPQLGAEWRVEVTA